MTTPPLRTPTTLNGSPYISSPAKISYDAYLNYNFSSPTPLPSNARDTPAAISPRQYQLAHFGQDLFSSRESPFKPRSAYLSQESDALNAIDASARDLRTFRTLSAAETLLSVQNDTYGESPRKRGSFGFDDDASHPSSQGSFTSSASFSSYSTRWPSSSQPRTPSRSSYRSSQSRNAFPATSPRAYSQRNASPGYVCSPFLNYAYPCKSPHTPHRAGCSFDSAFPGEDSSAANPFEIGRTPGRFHFHSPLALEEPVAPTDISPILRHGESVTLEEAPVKHKRTKPMPTRAFSPEFSDSDEDDFETGLYASSNTACDSPARFLPCIAMPSPSFTSRDVQGESDTEDIAELLYPQTRSSSPVEDLARNGSSPPPSSPTANEYSDQDGPVPSDSISLSSTGCTRIRAARAKADRAIAAVFSQSTPEKPKKEAHSLKDPLPRLAIDSDRSSPLSSAPSSPTGGTMGDLAPLSIERPTRAKTRALAAVFDLEQGQRKHSSSSYSVGSSRSRKRKTTAQDTSVSASARKRAKISRHVRLQDETSEQQGPSSVMEDNNLAECDNRRDLENRTFPASVPIASSYPLFYRKFPVIRNKLNPSVVSGATPNAPRTVWDLYTPRWVKGRGTAKVGLCPICAEAPANGGEGKKLWLSMKFSAFKCYHMQYAHGISPKNGLPFSPPTDFSTTNRHPDVKQNYKSKQEKTRIEQGKCHKCHKWVPVEGIKDIEVKVKEIFWWKHAATCHYGSTLAGECDVFIRDEAHETALAAADEDD